MVELRKRKLETETSESSSKKPSLVQSLLTSRKSSGRAATKSASSSLYKQGDTINLDGFGGEFDLTDGEKATLNGLISISVGGVVLFTYPKANTPACIAQACLFRDCYQAISAYGFALYGISQDSIKTNLNFKSKHHLPYTLICDQTGGLIDALGFRNPPKGIQRGVIVIEKSGKILAVLKGGPNATVEAVYPLIEASENADAWPTLEAATTSQAPGTAHGADAEHAWQHVTEATI